MTKIYGLEMVGITAVGLPIHGDDRERIDFELGWNLSALYHLPEAVEAPRGSLFRDR